VVPSPETSLKSFVADQILIKKKKRGKGEGGRKKGGEKEEEYPLPPSASSVVPVARPSGNHPGHRVARSTGETKKEKRERGRGEKEKRERSSVWVSLTTMSRPQFIVDLVTAPLLGQGLGEEGEKERNGKGEKGKMSVCGAALD